MKLVYLFTLSSLFMIAGTKMNAQNITPVKPFEFEISIGGTYGIDKYVGKKLIGPALALESRYNFPQNPMDFRITAYSKLGYKGYNNFGISVGYVFGGGRKKVQ